jgi:hypothetical protein
MNTLQKKNKKTNALKLDEYLKKLKKKLIPPFMSKMAIVYI